MNKSIILGNLDFLIQINGLTRSDVINDLNLSPDFLSEIRTSSDINLDMLQKLSDYFFIDLKMLLNKNLSKRQHLDTPIAVWNHLCYLKVHLLRLDMMTSRHQRIFKDKDLRYAKYREVTQVFQNIDHILSQYQRLTVQLWDIVRTCFAVAE